MSRSTRRTPIFGNSKAKSERWDKRFWHRRFRRAVKQALRHAYEIMPHFRVVSDPWLFAKDGKVWRGPGRKRGTWDRYTDYLRK